jgi:hypothetical protein
MGQPWVNITFTKKVLSVETRRSRVNTDADLRDLRNAVIAASRVSSFYETYIQKAKSLGRPVNIMPRDSTQILLQMINQKVYVCERLEEREPCIVASSILWDYELPVPSSGGHCGYAPERFLEFGTQVSTLPGFQLQWVLTAITLIEQLVFDPTGVMYAATYGDNEHAAENFSGTMRFAEWLTLPPTLESTRLHHLEDGGAAELARGVRWFRPTIETVVSAANLILDLHRNPNRTVKIASGKTAESYPVKGVHFSFDPDGFKLATFADILAFCRKISERNPRDLTELKAAAGNFSITDDFICLD